MERFITQTSSVPLTTSTTFLNKYDEHSTLAGNDSTMEAFWAEQAKAIDWYKEPDVIFDKSTAPLYTWFKGGVLNTSYNCIDRHAKKDPSRKALIYENSFGFPSAEYTYSELLDNVSRLAGVLCDHGVRKGDVVMIYMPNIPEAMFSIFACSRIGAIHYTIFAGIEGEGLTYLINASRPKLILLASLSMINNKITDLKTIMDEALKTSNSPDVKKIVVQREAYKAKLIEDKDFEFYSELSRAKSQEPVPVDSTDPLFLLNTSGTTGTPKSLLFLNGSYCVGSYYNISTILDLREGEAMMTNSGIAWAGCTIFCVYGSFLVGGTSLLFEGVLADNPERPWNLCQKHKIKAWFTFPSLVRTLRKTDPDATCMHRADLSSLKTVIYGGERMDASTHNWLAQNLPSSCLAFNVYGQTEFGMCLATNPQKLHLFSYKEGSCSKPLPGFHFMILGDNNELAPSNTPGKVMIKLPLPPASAVTLFNNDQAFIERYLTTNPGYYTTGDTGYLDKDGYLYINGRMDDIIVTMAFNVNAVHVEEAIINHPDIAEVAVARGPHLVSVEVPYGFIVLKKDVKRVDKEIEEECVQKVISTFGPWLYFNTCIIVEELPRNRAGKVLRRLLTSILYNQEIKATGMMINPHVLDDIKHKVKERGLGPNIDINISDP